jgi:hypothetical protein
MGVAGAFGLVYYSCGRFQNRACVCCCGGVNVGYGASGKGHQWRGVGDIGHLVWMVFIEEGCLGCFERLTPN